MWLVVDARPEIWQKDNVTRAIIDIGQRPRSSLPFSLRTFKQMALLRKLIVSTVTIVALYTVHGNTSVILADCLTEQCRHVWACFAYQDPNVCKLILIIQRVFYI